MNLDLTSLAKALGMKGLPSSRKQPRANGGGVEKRKRAAASYARDPAHADPAAKAYVNPAEERRREALERERKMMQRYRENRLLRFHKLVEEVPNVGKYCAMLDKCGKLDVFEVYSANDCNLDIAELVERYGLREKVPSAHDRFYLYEITRDWLQRMARVHDKLSEEVDPNDFFKQPAPTALSEAKAALGVT